MVKEMIARDVASDVEQFAAKVASRFGEQLESITFYPHPFTNGGLIIVPNDKVTFIPDLMSEVYQMSPPQLMIYFVRPSEFFELSMPGVFGWTIPLEEKPHLAFWLKNRGTVLFGRDIREEIKLPRDTSTFLEIHLQRIKHCIRNWVLEQLSRQNYKGIVREMERQVRYVMATALLSKQREWEYTREAIPSRFFEVFQNEQAENIWSELTDLTGQVDEQKEPPSRQSAFEAVWLFEQFIKRAGEYTA